MGFSTTVSYTKHVNILAASWDSLEFVGKFLLYKDQKFTDNERLKPSWP